MKSKKTTLIGTIPVLSLIIGTVLIFLEKASYTEVMAGIVATTALSQFLLGLNAKDNNVTHSKIDKSTYAKKAT